MQRYYSAAPHESGREDIVEFISNLFNTENNPVQRNGERGLSGVREAEAQELKTANGKRRPAVCRLPYVKSLSNARTLITCEIMRQTHSTARKSVFIQKSDKATHQHFSGNAASEFTFSRSRTNKQHQTADEQPGPPLSCLSLKAGLWVMFFFPLRFKLIS